MKKFSFFYIFGMYRPQHEQYGRAIFAIFLDAYSPTEIFSINGQLTLKENYLHLSPGEKFKPSTLDTAYAWRIDGLVMTEESLRLASKFDIGDHHRKGARLIIEHLHRLKIPRKIYIPNHRKYIPYKYRSKADAYVTALENGIQIAA